MKAFGYFITTVLGISCTWIGTWLRLSAYELAWLADWGYSGPREATVWAIREHAYQDLSQMVLGFGLLLLVVVLWHWLSASPASNIEEKQR